MLLSRRSPPWWFVLCVAVVTAVAMRHCVPDVGAWDSAPGDAPQPAYAFLGFLIALGSLLWKGLEIASKVTLAALKWVVVNLPLGVTKLGNGLKALGAGVLSGLKRSWEFTRKLYDDVLKPAWSKFWRIFDKFRTWLDSTFKPVLDWLRELRDNVLSFYRNYVRPWLDLIDVTRRLLRVLAALHIPFARELDRRLAKLESLIEKPFRLVLTKLNEVINAVNRIATLDGLLQRVALIRSLARDFKYAGNIWWHTIHRPATADEERRITEPGATKTPRQNAEDAVTLWRGDEHPRRSAFLEHVADFRIILRTLKR